MTKTWHVGLALTMGVVIGWFANAYLAPRYSLRAEGLYLLEERTGKVWKFRWDSSRARWVTEFVGEPSN